MIARVFKPAKASFGSGVAARDGTPLRVYAAGSLREAMTEIAQAFAAPGIPPVATIFGPSGVLRERIENGESAHVYASADIGNAEALARAGLAFAPVIFARNRLCALVGPGIDARPESLLDRMLDPAIRLGTSTPKADPAGDYAWQLFDKAERLLPGAFALLDAKALKLVGGTGSPEPPSDRPVYVSLLAQRKADIFLTYHTNAILAAREVHGARVVTIPEALAVGATYALTVLHEAPPAASRFALYVLSKPGQTILHRYGFSPVALA